MRLLGSILRRFAVVALASAPACTVSFEPLTADESKLPDNKYSAYTGADDRAGDEQIRITELTDPASGRVVVLVPMVHIGDAAFYREVQAECDRADVVLTEGVGASSNLTPGLFFTTYLFANYSRVAAHGGLTMQHEAFEWRANQRRGDLTRQEFQSQMPWWTPFTQTLFLPLLAAFSETWNLGNWVTRSAHVAVGKQTTFHEWFRHLFVQFLEDDEPNEEDDPLDSLILPGILKMRNEHLMERFDETVKDPAVKRVALPWGAAHMPGLVTLLKDRGYGITASRWVKSIRVRSLREDGEDTDRPTDFMIPWVIEWRSFGDAHSLSLLFQTIDWDSTQRGWSFDLVWALLASAGAGHDGRSFQLLPSLFDHPILYAWSSDGTKSHHRFLLFFDVTTGD